MVPLAKRKLARDMGIVALVASGSIFLACLPWNGDLERYGEAYFRVLLGLCALMFAAVVIWQMCRLLKGKPSLTVDQAGFHQGKRTIAWSDVRALTIEDVPSTRSQVRQLVVLAASGKPIRVSERQIDQPLADLITGIREWQREHQPIATRGSRGPAPLMLVDTQEGLFAKVAFETAAPGYDRNQVDLYLVLLGAQVEDLQARWRSVEGQAAQLESRLRATATNSDGQLASAAVDDLVQDGRSPVVFAVVDHGYDTTAVDHFLYEAGVRIGQLQGMVRRAEKRSASAEALLAALGGDEPT